MPRYRLIVAMLLHFAALLLAGILSSAANAFLVTAVSEPVMTAGHVTSVLAAYMTGDVTGLLAVMLMARHVLPLLGPVRE